MAMDKIEQKICDVIDAKAEEIIAFGNDIWSHAELGFKEFRTSKKFAEQLNALGLETIEGLSVTGVKSYLKGADAPGLKVCLMGEMDALPISNAEHSWGETNSAHCCGHHAQLTGVLGAAMALTDPEIKEALDGNVVFFGVPAEECVDLEYRNNLIKEGVIRYAGGKCDLINIGAMDDLDLVIGHHSTTLPGMGVSNGSSNGFVTKTAKFIGKSSHAAGAPHLGIDALNASAIAQSAIQFQRESFQDKDTVRVHGIVSRGGEAVNVIADDVRMEFLIRAKTIPAIKDASYKIDRALKAGALATGCGIEIETAPGYLTMIPCEDCTGLVEAVNDVYEVYDKKDTIACQHRGINGDYGHGTGSTDYGDVSMIMPLVQFGTGGFSGIGHHPSYDIADPYLAYVVTAKIFALAAYKMLKNNNEYAKNMISSFKQTLTKEEYLEYMESMMTVETMDIAPVPSFE